MAFELFEGKLTAEPERIEKETIPPILAQLPEGEVCFMYESDMVVNDDGEILLNLGTTIRECDEEDLDELIRVIHTPLGLVVDRSHSYEARNAADTIEEFERIESWGATSIAKDFAPVVGLIDAPFEFPLAAAILEEHYGIEITQINAF